MGRNALVANSLGHREDTRRRILINAVTISMCRAGACIGIHCDPIVILMDAHVYVTVGTICKSNDIVIV